MGNRKGIRLKIDKKVLKILKQAIRNKYGTIRMFCEYNGLKLSTIMHKLNKIKNPVFREDLDLWFYLITRKFWVWKAEEQFYLIKEDNLNVELLKKTYE